jgi:mannose-6-phosphate isomerase-like protein (cupin superfamily)
MTQTEVRPETSTDPQVYRLRTPLMKQGRLDTVVAKTETMQVRMKCYATGGENGLHAHTKEDHTFVILQGKARFWGKDDVEIATLGPKEAVLLPRGCFYRFESCGDEPLVLLRVGAKTGHTAPENRIKPDGTPIPGDSHDNKTETPIILEGAYFE